MAYEIVNTDGTLPFSVQDNVVNTSQFSLALIGRNVANYGQYFAQNTLRHLENFASVSPPAPGTKLIGQLWFDKGEDLLRVWDGTDWKRTGTVVASQRTQGRPSEGEGAGTQFFNLDTQKLEIHNGTAFVDASYPGEVTNAYSSDGNNGSPAYYGARLRTLFLKEASTGASWPVIALVYVKSGTGSNVGTTTVAGQQETIMSLFSDHGFIIDTNTMTPVGSETINYYSELTGTGGIASARTGRSPGQILKGQNSRQEYDATNTSVFSTVYATNIGDVSNPVDTQYVNTLTVNTQLNASVLGTTGDLTIGGSIGLTGDLVGTTSSITAANLTITANTTLSGDTTINGNLTLNGVNTQTLGTDAQKVEDIFSANVDVQELTVDGNASINSANITALTVQQLTTLNQITATGTSSFNGDVNLGDASADTITVNGAFVVDETTTFNDDVTFASGADLTISNGTLTLAGSSTIQGAASNVYIDNQSTSETKYLTFVNNNTNQSQYKLESDAGLSYAPDTNKLTTTGLEATGTVTFGSLSDGSITIDSIVDEDNMASNSATMLPTQQSVKAYVDSQVTAQDLDIQGDTGGALSIDLDSETLDIAGGTNISTAGSGNEITVNLNATLSGLTSVTSGAFVGDLTGDVTGDVTGSVTGSSGSCTGNSASASTVDIDTANDASTYYVTFTTETSSNGELKVDNAGAGMEYVPSTNTLTTGVFSGTATQAQYADLAEIYSADSEYEAGTVVKLGGSAEITMTTNHADTDVFGVVSTNPAFLMNKDAEGLPVALTGRVPVKVIGRVAKGERLVSSDVPGVAWALGDDEYDARAIIGRSLEDKEDGNEGIIEAVIGVK